MNSPKQEDIVSNFETVDDVVNFLYDNEEWETRYRALFDSNNPKDKESYERILKLEHYFRSKVNRQVTNRPLKPKETSYLQEMLNVPEPLQIEEPEVVQAI